jgi:hypothetical protein
MRGEEDYKFASASHVEPTSSLYAWHPPLLRSAESAVRRYRRTRDVRRRTADSGLSLMRFSMNNNRHS